MSLFTVKKPKKNVIPIRRIGSSASKNYLEEEEKEEEEEREDNMDIDEPLSVINQHDDTLESLVYRLQSL